MSTLLPALVIVGLVIYVQFRWQQWGRCLHCGHIHGADGKRAPVCQRCGKQKNA